MRCFVDTSAFLAVMNRDDENHPAAARTWEMLLREDWALVTSSYVLVETFALCQNRLGIKAIRTFHNDVMPFIQVEWIQREQHAAAAASVLAADRKKLSLVDCASFEIMRATGLNRVFTFDRHFAEQGFTPIPA